MNVKPQALAPGKSWLAAHPLVVIGALLSVCLGPFLNQAVQTDDTLFVWSAQWIQKHPADFYGFPVNWWGSTIPMWVATCNPPLQSYWLAAVGSLFGWHETVLHLACLAVAFAAAAGIYALAKLWCERPFLATVVAILTPAFLVSASTLMCDVPMLAFWIWALVFWERAMKSDQDRWQYLVAGLLAGLAVLTKYSVLPLLPVLPVMSLLRTRRLGWWCAGLLVPLVMVAGYEWLTARMYGHGLIALAGNYARTHRFGFPGGWEARGIIGLAFAGGCLLPVLFLAPWLWRRRTFLTGGVLMLGCLLAVFWPGHELGLLHAWVDPNGTVMKFWDFRLQVLLLTAAGLHLLLLAGTEAWQRRDRITLTLLFWIGSGFFFATVLNWTTSARNFLPVVPAVAILLVQRLKTRQENPGRSIWLIWPLVPAAAVVLSLVVANYQLANAARTGAKRVAAKYKTADHNLWLEGHGGFQYYMEQFGSQPVDIERSLLLPGDIVVVALLGDFVVLPPGSVGPVKTISVRLLSWMNLQASSARSAAGFYTADCGPVPFAVGEPQAQEYFIVKVFSRLQYQSQPANSQEVQAGAVPNFPSAKYSMDDGPFVAENLAATKQIGLARQFENDGKVEEAIRCYRTALSLDTNNFVALERLAWILATASTPGLRDGKAAVQLAAKAVELTDWRRPGMIGTLATAYAADGQYAKAVFVAQFARNLAIITGQTELAASISKLISLCAAANVADTPGSP